MRVLRSGIDAEICHLLASERTARNHALHGLHQNALRELAAEDLERTPLLDAARMAGVPVINLVLRLVAGEDDLLGVDNDDVVAVVHMRRVCGLMLAAQVVRDDRRDAAYDKALGVDQDPLLLDLGWFCGIGFHRVSGRAWFP